MARISFAAPAGMAVLMSLSIAAAPSARAAAPAAEAAAAELIAPNDTLQVDVFQAKDLGGTVQVDADGRILLPLVGEVPAAGQTPEQLSHSIARVLAAKYMKDPQVTVAVKESTSQKLTVDGAVMKPGIYPLTGPTTLLQAVALANGPDPQQANVHKVAVFRGGSDSARAVYDLDAIRNGKAADPAVYPTDVVVVSGSGTKSFLQTLSGLSPFAGAVRRW